MKTYLANQQKDQGGGSGDAYGVCGDGGQIGGAGRPGCPTSQLFDLRQDSHTAGLPELRSKLSEEAADYQVFN